MPFQVIEIDQGTGERIVSSQPFDTMDEAEQGAAASAAAFKGDTAYDQATGSWLVKDVRGRVCHIVVEQF